MQQAEAAVFRELVEGVYSFYGRDLSGFSLDVWWQALRLFDLDAIRDALGRHCVNPDTGQFLPKPADVVKMLEGSTLDSAVVAWTKVERGVQHVGTYATVAFDDPLIHRVLDDMGGWVQLGKKPAKEWPFVAKEFQQRYRGYKSRNQIPPYPPFLLGIIDGENGQHGFRLTAPTLIGEPKLALRVFEQGQAGSGLRITGPERVAHLLEVKKDAA